jgi:hypothetical protein
MISSTKAPKTKHQLSQAILKLRQPEIAIHEVLDKTSANLAKKAIDTQSNQTPSLTYSRSGKTLAVTLIRRLRPKIDL